jgi:hypothetical protein
MIMVQIMKKNIFLTFAPAMVHLSPPAESDEKGIR